MVAGQGSELKLAEVVAQVEEMGVWITQAAKAGTAAHDVERHLFRKVMEWGLMMLKAFFQLTGSGDLGDTFTLPDGRTLDRLPEVHDRRYVSVFGEARLSRTVYGTREGQALEFIPTDQRLSLPEDEQTVDILDRMHVLPRVWEAAQVFHKEGSEEAEEFVRERLLKVVQGQAGRMIGGLRQMGTKQALAGSARKRLKTLCGFLERNLHRMQYDQYLAAGSPIATGVIEGACRHVIKDRMERAGMRWKIPGAQAMLHLRTVAANDHWQEFQTFRVQQETKRLYPHSTALKNIPWPVAA